MNKSNKNRLFTFIAVPIMLALALFFTLNSFFSQNANIEQYQHIKAILKQFECANRKTGERYYYFHVDGDKRYWSYVNREDWPSCREAKETFRSMVNKEVELWLKDFQVVQFGVGSELVFSVEDYVGRHRRKGYQHGAFFLFLALVVLLYGKVKKINR